MKKIIVLIIIIITACNSQTKKKENSNHISKNENMEYFDINKYKDWESDLTNETTLNDRYLVKGQTKIRIITDEENIQVEETKINNPYKFVKVYASENKRLISKGEYFYDCSIGIVNEYDESGKLIKEEDHDKFFKLSVDDLIIKMKKEFNIDLLNVSERKSVSRSGGDLNTPPDYYISIPIKNSRSNRLISINANNGSIISDKIIDPDAKFLKNKK